MFCPISPMNMCDLCYFKNLKKGVKTLLFYTKKYKCWQKSIYKKYVFYSKFSKAPIYFFFCFLLEELFMIKFDSSNSYIFAAFSFTY